MVLRREEQENYDTVKKLSEIEEESMEETKDRAEEVKEAESYEEDLRKTHVVANLEDLAERKNCPRRKSHNVRSVRRKISQALLTTV